MEVSVPRRAIVSLIAFIISLIIFITNGREILSFYHPIPLEELSADDMKHGTYVVGDVSEMYVDPEALEKSTEPFDSFGGYTTLSNHFYYHFLLPICDGNYITMYVDDEETLEQITQLQHGADIEFYFYGKIINFEYATYGMTEEILGFSPTKIIPNHAYIQSDIDSEMTWCIGGFLGMVLTVFIYAHGERVTVTKRKSRRNSEK